MKKVFLGCALSLFVACSLPTNENSSSNNEIKKDSVNTLIESVIPKINYEANLNSYIYEGEWQNGYLVNPSELKGIAQKETIIFSNWNELDSTLSLDLRAFSRPNKTDSTLNLLSEYKWVDLSKYQYKVKFGDTLNVIQFSGIQAHFLFTIDSIIDNKMYYRYLGKK